MTHDPEKDIALTGIATEWRNAPRRRTRASRIVGLTAAAGLTLGSLEACAVDEPGQVYEGADGQTYVLPDGATRPAYKSLDDCLADVREQIDKMKQDGSEVTETAEQLCEPVDGYDGGHGVFIYPWYLYSRGYYLGPVMTPSTQWNSTRATGWHPVPNGGFARPGGYIQQAITKAPVGAKVGERVTIKGGFGGTGKGGFVRGGGS